MLGFAGCSFLFLSRIYWCLYHNSLIEYCNFQISQQDTPFSLPYPFPTPYNVINKVRFSASSRSTAPQLQSNSAELHCHNTNLCKCLGQADVSHNFSVPGYFRPSPGPLTKNFKMKEKSSLPPFLTLSKGCESQGDIHSFLNLLKGENRHFTRW